MRATVLGARGGSEGRGTASREPSGTGGEPRRRWSAHIAAGCLLIAMLGWIPAAQGATAALPMNVTLVGIDTATTLNFDMTGASAVEAADIVIEFDQPAVLTVTGDVILSALGTNCSESTNPVGGVLRVGISCLGMGDTGTLFSIPVKASAPGTTNLTITRCSLNEDAIPCVTSVGSVTVLLPTATPTSTPTATATPTITATPSRTPTVTFTASPTQTNTATSTASRTSTVTNTPTRSATATDTSTRTITPTSTSTRTATVTFTATPTRTSTFTFTVTATPTPTPLPALDSAYVTQAVPTSMVAGQSYSVSLTLTNIGASTWTAAGNFRLGSQNPQGNLTWGMNRVYLDGADSIATGQQKTFSWTVTAPTTPGTYAFQWKMVQEGVAWFGATTSTVLVNVGAGTLDAAPVGQIVPTTMSAGQSYDVSVTMQNTGTATWTAANSVRLGSQNPQGNLTWGMNRVYMNGNESIGSGQQKTFSWQVTAPATAGTYAFQWKMVQDGVAWFGSPTQTVLVNVTGGSGGTFDAAAVTQSVPPNMSPGQAYNVSVTMQNTGTATWTAAGGIRLGSQNPQGNSTWGMNRVFLNANDSIAPGQQKTFSWTVTAPSVLATYNFQWRMVQEGVAWFGATSTNVPVSVGGTPNAAFVSQGLPASMTAGQENIVSVTMQNTGTTTWTAAGGYRLGSQNPQGNQTWGMNRVNLDPGDSIAPGQQKTFAWTVTPPLTPGTYNFQWKMVQEGVTWFGAPTTNATVRVDP